MFNIKHIDHLVIRVRNLQPMLDFYINVIGCTLEKTQEELGLYQLRAGDSLIDFIPVEGPLGRIGGPSIYVNDPEGNVVELKGPPWSSSSK